MDDGEEQDVKVEVLDKGKMEGLPDVPGAVNFILGGRSFSIYEVTDEGLTQVFDSGSDFERLTAELYPENFNASNKNNKMDGRSDAKGPEPESVTVAQVGERTYAYIGLERIGGVMLYDITDPENVFFCGYINSRDFSVDFPDQGTDPAQGDVSVEGMCAVPATQSPTGYPLLLAANEVSGTVAVYQQQEGFVDPNPTVPTGPVTGGSVRVSPAQAAAGQIVTVTVTPDEGYVLGSLTAVTGDGPVSLTKVSDTGYTFVMPQSSVTISAAFVEENGASALPFSDVDVDDWYYDAAVYAYEHDLMNGTTETTFNPTGTLTRAQLVTILWRLEGSPTIQSETAFSDVSSTAYCAAAVRWSASVGIANGYGNGSFGANDPITRQQLAAILYRYAAYKGCDVTARGDLTAYSDAASVSTYAVDALSWALAEGLVQGYSNMMLLPGGTANRAQAATILMR